MNYVELLSRIEEVNRCPGGKRTISKIVIESHLKPGAKVLEIGANTGFTSIEMAKINEADYIGIDISKEAIKIANQKLSKEPDFIKKQIKFEVGDAQKLNFDDNKFDLIVTGGANTFIENPEKAFKEYARVLKPYGMLSITNLFYIRKPPIELLKKLKEILGFEIKPWKSRYWLNIFKRSGLELYSYSETEMQARENNVVHKYVSNIMESNKNKFTKEEFDFLRNKWLEVMNIFNENHKYLGFMSVILRKNYVSEQEELFFEKGSVDIWNLEGDEMWND